ncbi:hypothetical protein J2I47_00010 [Fibrella sp. HMF5335]|uniref:Uncharacterized protein n=1 Tax=Fibrella rubiginis TaxID=2817060 RepID=A0A939K3A2_9BACT|nr:hypothetical protein [Fibrella rubiginis]MBO0934916.1 hypothetical protein [Fibrella rubiginis]
MNNRMNVTTQNPNVVLLPVSSGACPQDAKSIADRINAFRNSTLWSYTRQVILGIPDAPYSLEFPIDKVQQLLNSPGCVGMRVYFALEALPVGDLALSNASPKMVKSALSLVLVGHNAQNDDIISLDVTMASANQIACCGTPPPTRIGTTVINFMSL